MTDNFTKIINPFASRLGYRKNTVNVFIKIAFTDGRLSISGVEGPYRNGDCAGSCGQIDMHDCKPDELKQGWFAADIARLRNIWAKWHLNDMRAYSPEMKAQGWHEKAIMKCSVYEFSRTTETFKGAKNAEEAAIQAATKGDTFTPTPEQIRVLNIPYSVNIAVYENEPEPETPEGMKRATNIGDNGTKHPASHTLGWLSPADHPDGLLGRKVNPADKYGYGGKWWREDVPVDVLEWLQALPDTEVKPAWV